MQIPVLQEENFRYKFYLVRTPHRFIPVIDVSIETVVCIRGKVYIVIISATEKQILKVL